ncbi:olfactory receptor 5A1-like [Dromiciops gliroides]|uniref:olfactory receptor 5A1-like n=1 Tax=Dromiciops gliroides TaxID=33562 RepID=UPI001CC7690C|nr:olfactory receptor 5A1-like [Dromiciops gliroides]
MAPRSVEIGRNETSVTTFILLGFSDQPDLWIILFVIFLGIYLMTFTCNLGLIILIRTDSHLHSPMYFFLSFLAFIDICYSSAISPRMLSDFFHEEKSISLMGCATQYFFMSWMGLAECCLLSIMAYDRYVAICSPLRYSTIMDLRVCEKMVVGAYVSGFFSSLTQTISGFHLHFCGSNIINHFFCDVSQLMALSCSNPFIIQIILLVMVVLVGFFLFPTILMSYGYITVTVLKMPSAKGRRKAFITCASHLTVVILFYGTGFSVYIQSSSTHSKHLDKVLSVFYVILIPMLNPLIYSLRNKEIKDALKRVLEESKVY